MKTSSLFQVPSFWLRVGLVIFGWLSSVSAKGQEVQQNDTSRWEFSTDVNLYFIPDEFFIDPVIRADRRKLHLEARYNYEDLNTLSAWAGLNFSGGKKVEYEFTPIAGIVVGRSNGIAAGLEWSLAYKKFEFTSESEYLFETDDHASSYLYSWDDLSYSVNDWLWVGLSVQRTRLYKTALDIQRGLLVGAAYKQFEITAYVFNLGFDTPFAVVTLSANF